MRRDIIRNKIKEIHESVIMVQSNLPDTLEEFQDLGLVKDGIYKRIEFSIENVWDICSIINSELSSGIPQDEKDIIDNLMKSRILSIDLGEKLKIMKGFRNIVVHRYGSLDDEIAFLTLHEHLDDFQEFTSQIEDFLSRK
ncbi:MAG: DUF86 domain-containing protein [Methanobacteriaceae archaeon]|nr:DUF86 domain-containing protein [Methanobacteriaceae archaeon]